jgi:hypothetical protein
LAATSALFTLRQLLPLERHTLKPAISASVAVRHETLTPRWMRRTPKRAMPTAVGEPHWSALLSTWKPE